MATGQRNLVPTALLLALGVSMACKPTPSRTAEPMSTSQGQTEPGLAVTLTPGPGGSTTVVMEVSNPTDAALEFCTYHTAFEGMANDIFVVVREDGSEVPYRGKMKKRAPPSRQDFVKLRPGASKSAEIDLTLGYDLPTGRYEVHYRGSGISRLPDSPAIALDL